VARRRLRVAELFSERAIPLELFNGGGTGSLNLAAREPWLTEVSAGSGLYCPHLFDYYTNIQFEPAAFFALQVVRASDPGFVTCQGGGYIASGEPGWDRVPLPWLPRGLRLISTEGCGEVQTPLRLPADLALAPGEIVLFRHAKAGELMERFNEVLLVSGGKIIGRAKSYRGMERSFF
jgi:D-serine deaminase-like pyridoxal phosphate-dependent protein